MWKSQMKNFEGKVGFCSKCIGMPFVVIGWMFAASMPAQPQDVAEVKKGKVFAGGNAPSSLGKEITEYEKEIIEKRREIRKIKKEMRDIELKIKHKQSLKERTRREISKYENIGLENLSDEEKKKYNRALSLHSFLLEDIKLDEELLEAKRKLLEAKRKMHLIYKEVQENLSSIKRSLRKMKGDE